MKAVKLFVVAGLATVLGGGCGNAIKSKEDAAKALNRLGFAGSSAGNQSPGSGLGGDVTVTVKGKQGTAKVTIKTSAIAAEGLSFVEEIVYDKFSADGKNVFNGTMSLTLSIKINLTNPSGGSIDMKMVGAVDMTGEFDSKLECDVTMSMKFDDLKSQSGAKVSMTLNGKVKADGQEYVYNNETVTVEAHKA